MAYLPKKQKEPTIRFWIVTLFPETIESYVSTSIIGRARGYNQIQVHCINPRDFATDTHKTVDDRPFGGGPGMVMLAEPILRSVQAIQGKINQHKNTRAVIYMTSPGGIEFTNTHADMFVTPNETPYTDIIILCGRYEGIDFRVQHILNATPISIGNYVLTGGELPALVMIDCITRRLPGVLGKSESIEENRISSHEMYTRPATLVWEGAQYPVPPVFRSGDHQKIMNQRAQKPTD